MDEKLKATIEKIVLLSRQNTEFDKGLRKRLNIASANTVISDDKMVQIYEYCIERIIHKQAEEFYSDFPMKSIVPFLISDFARMESFRRKDNFGVFCLSLYQQIECITNKLCENATLTEIVDKMWGCAAYISSGKDVNPNLSMRASSNYSIADLIFGTNKALEKSQSTLQSQFAIDKVKILIYFLGYKAMMKNSDYDSYKEITTLLSDIYTCRNMNHRGNTLNKWEKEVLDRIMPLKSFYYFKFLGALAQYLEYIKTGLAFVPEIKKYCDTIEKKKVVPHINILGTIELKDDGRRRKR